MNYQDEYGMPDAYIRSDRASARRQINIEASRLHATARRDRFRAERDFQRLRTFMQLTLALATIAVYGAVLLAAAFAVRWMFSHWLGVPR